MMGGKNQRGRKRKKEKETDFFDFFLGRSKKFREMKNEIQTKGSLS